MTLTSISYLGTLVSRTPGTSGRKQPQAQTAPSHPTPQAPWPCRAPPPQQTYTKACFHPALQETILPPPSSFITLNQSRGCCCSLLLLPLPTPSCPVPLSSPQSVGFRPIDQSPLIGTHSSFDEPGRGRWRPRALGRAQRYIFRMCPAQPCLPECPAFSSFIQTPG